LLALAGFAAFTGFADLVFPVGAGFDAAILPGGEGGSAVLCTTLDPAMAPMRTIQPYLEDFVLGRDRDWLALVRGAVKEMGMSVLALPEGVNRLVGRVNRGELEVRVQGLRESADLVYAAAQQIVFGVLAAGAGVIAYLARVRGDRLMATSAAIGAVVFLLGLLKAMWSGRARRIEGRG